MLDDNDSSGAHIYVNMQERREEKQQMLTNAPQQQEIRNHLERDPGHRQVPDPREVESRETREDQDGDRDQRDPAERRQQGRDGVAEGLEHARAPGYRLP